MFESLLNLLVNTPESFSAKDAVKLTILIMQGEANSCQISAFLIALKVTGKDLEPEYISAVASALRSTSLAFPQSSHIVADIVGTGGDGQDTFNVSTASSIIAAGALGDSNVVIAKHGNRASSSKCGSADVLEEMGCSLNNIAPETALKILENSRFAFLFAQMYHPAMKIVSGPRKDLKMRTIFNFLGPLINPANPKRMVVGVWHQDFGRVMAESLILSGVEQGIVVCGNQGLDEISPIGDTHAWFFDSLGKVDYKIIHPTRDFGLKEHPLVPGGDRAHNASIMQNLLDNKLQGPILDFVLLNTSALLYVCGVAATFKIGVELARQSILSGEAKRVFQDFLKATT